MLELDRLLQGSIDMHVHFGPDAMMERRVDALELARLARQAGMRGVVLKSHDYPTAPVASVARQVVPDVELFGSLCLDSEVGGLNPHAVQTSAKLGAKVIWMPTFTAANQRIDNPLLKGKVSQGRQTVLDPEGKLLPPVGEILAIIRQFDMILATGHLGPEEIISLVTEARNSGLQKIVITHPLDAHVFLRSLTIDDLRHLVGLGAFVELTFIGLLPNIRASDPQSMAEAIKTLGAEHCVIATDLGQADNPLPPEGMRMFMATLLRNGISAGEIELMAKANPARLLGLE